MGRFSIYVVPFAALSLLWELRRRGLVPGPAVALPARGRLPTAVVAAVLAAAGLWTTGQLGAGLLGATGPISREGEWAAFGRAVPAGARVAAEWGSTHLYMFWAPQASYLNVLDPVFMARPFPQAYEALRALFEGREPDIPFTLEAELGSGHLALSRFSEPDLLRRLAFDPRLELRYEGWTLLYEAVPGKNGDFVSTGR